MPFVARLKSTGARIVITDCENPKSLNQEDLVCQFDDCGAPMYIRVSGVARTHFVHRPASPCSTKLESHPESETHRNGKLSISTWLKKHYAEQGYENVLTEIEVAVPKAGRVADVLVTFPGGMREAHEIQLASITPSDLERRTLAYHSEGISAIWWIGRNHPADSATNREWCLRELGECCLVDFASEEVDVEGVGSENHKSPDIFQR